MQNYYTHWNQCQSKATWQTHNQYLDYLINTSFQFSDIFRHFVLSFEDNAGTAAHKRYLLLIVEIKD